VNDKATIENLRKLLHKNQPVPFVTQFIGPSVVDMWNVVNQLLDIVEAQEQRIKQLEEALRGDGK